MADSFQFQDKSQQKLIPSSPQTKTTPPVVKDREDPTIHPRKLPKRKLSLANNPSPKKKPKVSSDDDVLSDDEVSPGGTTYTKGGFHRVIIGEIFENRYKAYHKIGTGGFSTVWLCSDIREKKAVALKIIKAKYPRTAIDEISLLKTIRNAAPNDPNSTKIVQLFDDFKITGRNGVHRCLVLEIVGENLLNLINRSPKGIGLPSQNVKNITRQILEGVNYLHTKCKIIHTDIKPENICVCSGNLIRDKIDPALTVCEVAVKIVDLGNACWINRHVSEEIQTLEYRCPESFLFATYGPSADVWSIACVVFELATRDYLFQSHGGKEYSLEEYHLAKMIQLLGKIPKGIALSGKKSRVFFDDKGELRHVKWLKPCGLYRLLMRVYKWSKNDAQLFAGFLLPMLAFDPKKRALPDVCLNHRWIRVGI